MFFGSAYEIYLAIINSRIQILLLYQKNLEYLEYHLDFLFLRHQHFHVEYCKYYKKYLLYLYLN